MRRRLPQRARWLSAMLLAATMVAGLALRKVPLGLPPAVVKHGGSILWALMIYWIASTLRPAWRPWRSAIAAGAVTSATELSQLLHVPTLDALRQTGVGALLFGRVFSVRDLATYAAAVVAGALVDGIIRHRRAPMSTDLLKLRYGDRPDSAFRLRNCVPSPPDAGCSPDRAR